MAVAEQEKVERGQDQPLEGIALVVRQSHVRVGGATRVHESVLERLGAQRRDAVEVGFQDKHVAVHLFADRHVDPRQIVLRPPEMKRLGVKEGERVEVRPYTTGRAAVRGAFARAGARLSRRLDLTDSETKGGE